MGALLHPFSKPSATEFIRVVRGEGAAVWEEHGRRYVDGLASLWHCNVGHGREEVADAVAKQMQQLETYHCFEKFTNPAVEELADRLVALAPVPGSRVFLTSGGSESVDTAVKLSRIAHAQAGHPERTIIVSRTPSYHGVTYGAMTLTGLPLEPHGLRAWPWRRGPGRQGRPRRGAAGFPGPPGTGGRGLSQRLSSARVASGHRPPDTCRGCGRCATSMVRTSCWTRSSAASAGSAAFAGTHFGVVADLTTFAKGVTSGYVPLGGVLVAPSVHEAVSADPAFVLRHGFTYSGHAAAAVAALACLDIIEREGLVARAMEIGRRLEPASTRLAHRRARGRRPRARCPLGRERQRRRRPGGSA